MRAALVLFALAACTEPGVYIEVIASADVDEVELYLGASECTEQDTVTGESCTKLQPDTFARAVDAKIFIRDRDEPYRATVEDGSAWFRLGVEELAVMPRIVAVGRLDGSARSVAVVPNLELDSTRKVQIVLQDAPSWDTDETFEGVGVMEWAGGRCIGVHGAVDEHLFVVAAGDPDCDAVDIECDPLAYLAEASSDRPCLSATADQCSIGSMGCSERTPSQTDCLPGDTPLPSELCERCDTDPNPLGCVVEGIRDTFPRVTCELYYGDAPENGSAACPDDTPGSFPAPFVDAALGQLFCPSESVIAPVQLPLDWRTEYSSSQGVTYSLGTSPISCAVELAWSPTVLPNQILVEPVNETLLFWARGNTGGRDRVMPLELRFAKTCEETPRCEVVDE